MSQSLKKMLAGVAGVAALALGGSAVAGAATSHPSTTSTPSSTVSNDPAHDTASPETAVKAATGTANDRHDAHGLRDHRDKSGGSTSEVHLDS